MRHVTLIAVVLTGTALAMLVSGQTRQTSRAQAAGSGQLDAAMTAFWAADGNGDRTMLYGAELHVTVP